MINPVSQLYLQKNFLIAARYLYVQYVHAERIFRIILTDNSCGRIAPSKHRALLMLKTENIFSRVPMLESPSRVRLVAAMIGSSSGSAGQLLSPSISLALEGLWEVVSATTRDISGVSRCCSVAVDDLVEMAGSPSSSSSFSSFSFSSSSFWSFASSLAAFSWASVDFFFSAVIWKGFPVYKLVKCTRNITTIGNKMSKIFSLRMLLVSL